MAAEPKNPYYDELHDAVFDAVKISLGMTEEDANKLIRYSQPHGESHVMTPIGPDENRCYIRFTSAPLSGVGTRERHYRPTMDEELADKTVTLTDGITASVIFYGPDAPSNAEKLYIGIHEDEARMRLKMNNIAPANIGNLPVWLPELVNGVWITRCDLEIRFYRVVEYVEEVSAMATSPEIVIRRER